MSVSEGVNYKDRQIIVHGSPWAAIWLMAWPLLLNHFIISLASSFDVYIAGRIGSVAQAAIGIAGQVWYLLVLLTVALSAGTGALVSRYFGAKNITKAINAARYSILFAMCFGLISTSIGLLFCKDLFIVLGATPEVCKAGKQFLSVDLFTQIPFTLIWVINSILRAKGNARAPMIAWFIMLISILFFDYLFCLGPFRLGLPGIAYSWLISGFIGLAFEIYIISQSSFKSSLNLWHKFNVKKMRIWFQRILNIGLPACIQDLAWVLTNFTLIKILAMTQNPDASQASWSIGLRLEEMIGGMPIYALGMAVATIVGQNLGAGYLARAKKFGFQVALVGFIYNTIVGLGMYFGASAIAQLMTNDTNVHTFTIQYLKINGPIQPIIAIWLILYGAMQGAGYTKIPMWTTIFVISIVRLPICYYLTKVSCLETTGVFLGVAITACLMGFIAVYQFIYGHWQEQHV